MSQARAELRSLRDVVIPLDKAHLEGELTVPRGASGIVLFAHGSGSSRHSPRNKYVARTLHDSCIGTLLFDLLTTEEEEQEKYTRDLRFDIDLLAKRLVYATNWIRETFRPCRSDTSVQVPELRRRWSQRPSLKNKLLSLYRAVAVPIWPEHRSRRSRLRHC